MKTQFQQNEATGGRQKCDKNATKMRQKCDKNDETLTLTLTLKPTTQTLKPTQRSFILQTK